MADLFSVAESDTDAPTTRAPLPAILPGQTPPPPDHVTDLLSALDYQASAQPDRPLLFFLEEGSETVRLTLRQLWEAAGRVAGGLLHCGVQPGDRIAIMLPTELGFISTFFGILWAGAIPVPIYPPFRPDQLEDYVTRQSAILRVAGVRLLVSFQNVRQVVSLLKLHAPSLQSVLTVAELSGDPPSPLPRETALLQFTSGSTGLPKGVVLSHANLLANIRAYGRALDLRPEDFVASWLPLYHDMGLIGTLLGSIYHGRPLALMPPQDFLARPSRWLRTMSDYRGTISAAPNFAYEICARRIPDEELEGLDLSSWRVAFNGAEPVRPGTLQRFADRMERFGFRRHALLPTYGLAEASLALTFPPVGRPPAIKRVSRRRLEKDGLAALPRAQEGELELVSCGRPLEAMEVRIANDRGQVLESYRQGRIQFRGPSAMQGYYDNPQATAAVMVDDWTDTGDLGFLAEGELYVTGRRKDLILKAGRNIHPQDIEDVVAEVAGVRRGCVAAFGVSQAEQGTEALVIVAETRDLASTSELQRSIEQKVVGCFGLPADQIVMAGPGTIPKTPSGKIRRSECKERYLAGTLGSPARPAVQYARLLFKRGRGLSRKLLRFPAHAAHSIWCLSLLSIGFALPHLVSLVDRRRALELLGPLSRTYLKLSGMQLEIEGRAVPSPCLVVCNHSSTLDPVALMAAWPEPLKFLVAPWVAEVVYLRFLLSRLGYLRVTRGDPEAVFSHACEMRAVLQQGDSLAAFPEGGFEPDPGLRPFALGVFQVAAETGVPVVPVAISGTREAQPWPSVVPRPGKLRVVLGTPLTPSGTEWRDVVGLARAAREWIAQRCGEPLVGRRLRRED